MASTTIGDKTITTYLKKIIGFPVGQIIPLTNSDISIGRSKKSDICIHHANISRSHCTLNYSTDGWFLTDLGGVNGTFIDSNKLMPQIPHPLKDGISIYLGPPSDSPVAFVFRKNKVEKTPKEEKEQLPIIKESPNDDYQNQSQSTQPNLKRRANTNNHSSPSKKHAPSTSSHQPVSSKSTTDGKDSDNSSDISIHSLDSLKTRIRKINSHKKKKHSSNFRNNATSTSASLRPSSSKFDCIPSTSSTRLTFKIKSGAAEKLSHLKKITPGVFKELESLFNDESDSLAETDNGREDSESLLTDFMLLTNAGPNSLQQSAENVFPCGTKESEEAIALEKCLRKKNKGKNLNDQLKKELVELLKENSEQKKKINKFIEASTSKKEPQENLGDMLEEELICNICTEVFIKATTLGCSHTFCEHCIAQWKKKQKRCPMCREMITSESRVLIMDNFIDKVVGKLDKVYQDKRKEVVASREAAKVNAKVKKTKKKKSSRSRASRRPSTTPIGVRRDIHEDLRQWRVNLLNEVPFHVGESVELLETSSGSDGAGFEYCLFCGEPGHNTNGCPRLS